MGRAEVGVGFWDEAVEDGGGMSRKMTSGASI